MDREPTKHAPELDEQLTRQAEGLVPGGGTIRAEKPKEPEPTHEITDRAQAEPPQQCAPADAPGMTPRDVALHNALATLLAGVVFPADREKLLWHLEHLNASGPVSAAIASLPGKREFHTVEEVADALGIGT